jgi:hypothetical protein
MGRLFRLFKPEFQRLFHQPRGGLASSLRL